MDRNSFSATVVDEDLLLQLEVDENLRQSYVFLEAHRDFHGFWRVESFDRELYFNLGDVIGPYRSVAPNGLDAFLQAAYECEYRVAFFEDPADILDRYATLHVEPDVALQSDLPGTINGFLPFQVQGFNFLKDLTGGVAMWSTGTGKTALASALVKHHVEHQTFDLCFFVVKSNNKVNTQRTLKGLAGLDSIVVSGEKKTRQALYASMADLQDPRIIVTNYEKFRVDHDEMLSLFDSDKRILVVWDEMPTKLKNRSSKLYRAVCKCLYTTPPPQVSAEKVRPRTLRQYMLSATPIENDPEDFFNCVRLLDPSIYGTVADFRSEYVARWSYFDANKPESWHKLDRMGMKAARIVHQVDKTDPDIASQFPAFLPIERYIDWDEDDRKVYDKFTKELMKAVAEEDEDDAGISVIAAIGLMQMLCDAPSMVTNSAARREGYEAALAAWHDQDRTDVRTGEEATRLMNMQKGSEAALKLIEALGAKLTDSKHTKREELRSILCDEHPDEKVVVFTAFSKALLSIISSWLDEWGVKHVVYRGTLTQRQAAQDAFMEDPDVRVFLSSDAGSDSINLQVASVVVHYDFPWKWSTLIQRENRIHRVTSTFKTVRAYALIMAASVEDRKKATLNRKKGYHEGVFKGVIADQSQSARMSKDDLYYILSG